VSYERQDRLKALVLAVCAFLLYTATRTRHFGGDDTVFAIAVQRWLDVGALEPTFIHPHHLLYNPTVAGLSWLVRLLTGSVFVLDIGAAVSAAAAAAAAAGTYLVLRRHEVDNDSALMAAVTLVLAGGVWKYATRMEVYTLAAAGVVVWLFAVADGRGSWRKEAAGFASPWLGHSVLGLLVLPGAWLLRGRPRVLMAAILGGVVVPGAIVVGLLAGIRKVDGLAGVPAIFAGPGLGRWLSAPDPIGALRALRGLVVWRSYHALPVYPSWVMWTFDLLGAIAAAVLGALFIWGVCRRGSPRWLSGRPGGAGRPRGAGAAVAGLGLGQHRARGRRGAPLRGLGCGRRVVDPASGRARVAGCGRGLASGRERSWFGAPRNPAAPEPGHGGGGPCSADDPGRRNAGDDRGRSRATSRAALSGIAPRGRSHVARSLGTPRRRTSGSRRRTLAADGGEGEGSLDARRSGFGGGDVMGGRAGHLGG